MLTQQQCDQAMAPCYQQGLLAAGIMSSFLRALLHDPMNILAWVSQTCIMSKVYNISYHYYAMDPTQMIPQANLSA